jgi:hypothetical protein
VRCDDFKIILKKNGSAMFAPSGATVLTQARSLNMSSLSDHIAKSEAWLVYSEQTSFHRLWFLVSAIDAESRYPISHNFVLSIPVRIYAALRQWPGVHELEKELADDGKTWTSANLLEWAEKRSKYLGVELSNFRHMPLSQILGIDPSIEKAIVAAKAWCKDLGPNRPRQSQIEFLEAIMQTPKGMTPDDINEKLETEWSDPEMSCRDRKRTINKNKEKLGFEVAHIDGTFRVMPLHYDSYGIPI